MSRRRDLESSEWFHIVHKGADDQDIFSAPSHRTVYEGFMADAFERSAIELHAYAWMTNHLHKLVRVPNGGLPEAMRLLGMRYATVYNGWTDRTGPLFTARYFSEPVTSDAQLAQTARYIHRNPLPIVGTAGLVEYRWSSLGALCGRRPVPPWLSTGLVTDGFDVGGYERYVLAPQPSDRFGLGALPPLTPTECDDIERAVAAVTGRPIDELWARKGKLSDAPRTLAIMLAVELRAGSSAEMAARYGLSDLRSVRRIARRGRVRAAESAAFALLRDQVLASLDDTPVVVPAALGTGNFERDRGSHCPGHGELRAG